MKNKIAMGIVVLAAVVLVSGVSILAAATAGTQADPFITLSYLTEVFRPSVITEVRAVEQQVTQRFETRAAQLESQLESGQVGTQQPTPGTSEVFTLVTLSDGQSLICSVGTEIMLRIGSAVASGSEPALVNYTTGSTLSAGSALIANNMYLVTIEGNGIRATAETVRVLVRGDYRIT